MCKRKKKKKERWERRIREMKREGQMWEIVNRKRKKRKEMNREIKLEEWELFFRELLGLEAREKTEEKKGKKGMKKT